MADVDEETNRHVAAIINGVMQANRNEGSVVSPSTTGTNMSLPPMHQHGPHARPPHAVNSVQAQQSNASVTSQVTYDHNGNIL